MGHSALSKDGVPSCHQHGAAPEGDSCQWWQGSLVPTEAGRVGLPVGMLTLGGGREVRGVPCTGTSRQ